MKSSEASHLSRRALRLATVEKHKILAFIVDKEHNRKSASVFFEWLRYIYETQRPSFVGWCPNKWFIRHYLSQDVLPSHTHLGTKTKMDFDWCALIQLICRDLILLTQDSPRSTVSRESCHYFLLKCFRGFSDVNCSGKTLDPVVRHTRFTRHFLEV